MTNNIINALKELEKEPLLKQLGEELNKPNIFYILKLQGMEIRHSNFLGWLLDPDENHGLKDAFLREFIERIPTDELNKCQLNTNNGLDLTEVKIKREWENIDILIETHKFVVCVENKIWSQEDKGDNKQVGNGNESKEDVKYEKRVGQLERYVGAVKESYKNKEHIFLFLTPDGIVPTDTRYIIYTYHQIAAIIENFICNKKRYSMNSRSREYIKDYLTVLRREIMFNDKTNDLARKIYVKRADALELVNKAVNHRRKRIFTICEELIKEYGWKLRPTKEPYATFLTPKLDKLKKITSGGDNKYWKNKESFLFEVFYDADKESIIFRTAISKSEKNREELVGILEALPDAKKIKGDTVWLYHIQEVLKIEIMNYEDSVLKEKINKFFLSNLKPRVEEIGKAISYIKP